MSFNFCLLKVESRYFSHAEEERNAYKAKQIHKMTTKYYHSKWSQVVILSENSCHFVNLLSFTRCSFYLSQLEKKSCDSTPNTQKLQDMQSTSVTANKMNIAIGFLMTQLEEFVNCLNHVKVLVLSFAPNVFLENQVVNRGFAVLQEYVRYVKASLIEKCI